MLIQRYKRLNILVVSLLLVPAAFAQVTSEDIGTEKLAQTSFKFLQISTDARAAALGDAMTAFDMQSSVAMFYNPAGMAHMTNQFSAGFGMTQWIADITYNAASAAYNTEKYGIFGVSLMFSDYGNNFIGTFASANEQGYTEYSAVGVEEPNPKTMMVGLGYAIALTDRFAVGGNAKYVSQDLGLAVISSDASTEKNENSTVAFDFGVLYKTGFRSLNFAMSVRNFASELTYVDESFELPLTFSVGMSMNVFDLTNIDQSTHAFNLMIDAKRPRDFSEQLKIGGEYTFMNILSVRAGYSYPSDEQGISLGAGLQYDASSFGASINYAYTDFGIFNAVHRIGVNLSF